MDPFNINAEMAASLDNLSGEDICVFAEMQQEKLGNGPVKDEQIELCIYACFIVSKKMRSMNYLERAIQQTRTWMAELATDHPGRPRRLQILDFLSAWMIQLGFVSELNIKQELTDEANTETIDRKQEVTIKNAKEYQETGVLGTLNEAIGIMPKSLDLVGEYITPGVLANLAIMLWAGFHRTGDMADLNRAVGATDMAVDATLQDHPNQVIYLSNLGNLLRT